LGEVATEACHRRWNYFPLGMRIREPHSPNTLQFYLLITPWYKEIVRRIRTNWIGIRMSPPLLLRISPLDYLQLGKEESDWTGIVKDKGYHDHQIVTKYMAWDMREEFRRQQ
jgi:hypothetical protein